MDAELNVDDLTQDQRYCFTENDLECFKVFYKEKISEYNKNYDEHIKEFEKMRKKDFKFSKRNSKLDKQFKARTREDLINTVKKCIRELIIQEYFLTTKIRIHF